MIYENVELYNVSELVEINGIKNIISRIPNDLRVTLNESAKLRAIMSAGCEIRFNLKSEKAKITLKAVEKEQKGIVEVYQGNFFISWHLITENPTTIEISHPANMEELKKVSEEKNLPFDPYLTRVILPYGVTLKIENIEGDCQLPERNQTPDKKLLSYGSSITHGATALRPTGTYAMRTAQLLGVDLINLGFGGGAHLEKQMADYIAERDDWNFATLEMGINMVGGFEVEEFKERVEYFIPKIAKAHPDKYIFCIDIFQFRMDFYPEEKKQKEFRRIVKETVEKLNMPEVIHVSGLEILKSPSGLTSDLVHPSAGGMEEMAGNLSETIKKYVSI